jgi:hypothetical protein
MSFSEVGLRFFYRREIEAISLVNIENHTPLEPRRPAEGGRRRARASLFPKRNDGRDTGYRGRFTPEGTNGRIDLVHLDVPAHNYQSVVEGWETHYWGPWRRYLAG